jgi:transposase
MLPHEFGTWKTGYFYFRKWKVEGGFESMMHHLRESVRNACGKAISSNTGLIDYRTDELLIISEAVNMASVGARMSKADRSISLLIRLD